MDARRPARLLVITGLSGAGKTSVMHALEDVGYFCVDNMPAGLLPRLVDLMDGSQAAMNRPAVVLDIRQEGFPESFEDVLPQIRTRGVEPEVVFLEATTESLLRRYAQTARPHPLASGRTLREGIEAERASLRRLREAADRVIDTSTWNVHEARRCFQQIYMPDGVPRKRLRIELISFGYARGVPQEADLVVDVRFLPNPHYDAALRDLDGRHPAVQRAVQADRGPREILERCFQWVDTLVAFLEDVDRAYLKIGFGCTGGRHRSVAAVVWMEERLRSAGYLPKVSHRDIEGGAVPDPC